ncbi:hypothetical protein FLW53_27965 [Microbispora sp. SCL1-1]|uniref:hypothetical protein n=1 Tax=Microbispora TaxID=2005 RepID=UPI00115912E9|nr:MULTISPECIES: hypothetical protein [unclassified Microbispora]NJP27978.1 hypothetical protein [Microbispora sp. CL1-1]TQS10333.1 hypothetical protein FLW53_27965 [Microbispora sp. SCL1-1]
MSEHLARYLETLSRTQHALSSGFRALRRGHPRESDLCGVCERLAAQCRDHTERLEPFLHRYRSAESRDPGSAPSRPTGLDTFGTGGFDAGFDSGFDAAGFGTGSFDAGGFGRGEFDTGEFDTGGFAAGAFDAASIDAASIDAASIDGGDFEAAGAETGTARRPRMTPGSRGDGGGLALLRELHGLYLLATECDLSWSVVAQAARGLRDDELLGLARHCAPETAVQLLWLRTRMHQAAPQVLVVQSASPQKGDKSRH